MSTVRNTISVLLALLALLLAPLVLAPAASAKGDTAIPAGDLKVTVARRGAVLSVPDILYDPGLQAVLAEVHAFYATHAAEQTTPQQLAAALAPNHAAVTTLDERDEHVFLSEATGGLQDVLRNWSCAIQVEDAVGEADPVIISLRVRTVVGDGSAFTSPAVGTRTFRIGREAFATSCDDLLADESVWAVREQVDDYIRLLDGAAATPPALAAYLEGWTEAQDVSLNVADIRYVTVVDPDTGEESIVCIVDRDIQVTLSSGDKVVVTYEEIVSIL